VFKDLLFNSAKLVGLLVTVAFGLSVSGQSPTGGVKTSNSDEVAQVFVIPIHGPITSTQLYILRRGVKEAIETENSAILIDVDTPGGEVQTTLEIMKVLDRFDGETLAFIREEAVSAGAYIVSSSEYIYMAPKSVVGAADVVLGTGDDVPETMKRKIRSLLRAKVRAYNNEHPYRSDVVRAMMEDEFVLEVEGEKLKDEGELLTLTAEEAARKFGKPPSPLFSMGIQEEIEDVLKQHFGEGKYAIKSFEVTWSEELAQQLNLITPILLGLGMLGLFIEFKTPGFGVFGIIGLSLLAVVFMSHYVAGLSGHEEIIFFLLGVGLIFIEVFLLPGTVIPALLGAALVIGSLIYAIADYWPGNMGDFTFDEDSIQIFDFTLGTFLKPAVQVVQGFILAIIGAMIAVRLLPKTSFWNKIVLESSVGKLDPVVSAGGASSNQDTALPEPGTIGESVTDLFPSGEIEIDGKRYQARIKVGSIRRGNPVIVKGKEDFSLVVEEKKETET
jgi:membrane-bound serine protease (ClpP class)